MLQIRRPSPGQLAYEIISGPDDLATKRTRLEELAERYPGDSNVAGYFESLAMQEDLENSDRCGGSSDDHDADARSEIT